MKKLINIYLTLIMCISIITLSSCSEKTPAATGIILEDTNAEQVDNIVLTDDEISEEVQQEDTVSQDETQEASYDDILTEKPASETDINETDSSDNTEAITETENADRYNFRILTRSEQLSDQYADAENGDIINDAVYRRNEAVKTLLGIDITVTESYSDNASEAINQILSGNDKYDVVFPDAKTAFDYAVKGAAIDFNTISTINTTNEWWAEDVVNSCTVNGHLYVLDGDISLSRLSNAPCVLFNKRIFDEIGYEYPYQMVKDGTWTFDEFSKLAKQGVMDLNGDDKITAEADTLGFYTYNNTAPVSALYAGGQRIYSNGPDGIPLLSVNSAKTVDIFTKLFTFTESDCAFMHSGKWDTNSGIFGEGRVMFTDIHSLGEVRELRNMADEFGILPWPKFYAEDEYMTSFSENASLMIMPVTVSDPEKSGEIIEALCAEGSNNVIPAFYDTVLQTKFSRDYESEEMLNIIENSLVYDIGYLTSSQFGHIGSELAGMKNPDFYSYYAQGEKDALSELNSFIKAYGNVG